MWQFLWHLQKVPQLSATLPKLLAIIRLKEGAVHFIN